MFKNKKEVDKHVTDILKKIKNENERNLRCYCIAKLYYAIKEYESARKYLAAFLSVREKHAPSHKLMAQIFENLNQYERALQSYKRSLEIDETQRDIVLKVCDLYCRLPIDVDRGRYWADRAEAIFPHHKTVFQLRETLMKADGEANASELEKLIASELAARPKDVHLRIKLLRLYVDTERIDLAYQHAIQVEALQPFSNSYDWYSCLLDVYEAFLEDERHTANVEFYLNLLFCLDRLIHLTLLCRSINDSADMLMKFDRYLEKGRCDVGIVSTGTNNNATEADELWSEVMEHMQGQLYFHMATFILKRAKLDQGKWKESCRIAAALLMTALSFEPDLAKTVTKNKNDSFRKMLECCRHAGIYRTSQAGHLVLSMSCKGSNNSWAQQIKQQCASVQMKERIYQRIAGGKTDNRSNMNQSFFLNSQTFCDVEYRVVTNEHLWSFDKECCRQDPENLALLVWLCLQIQDCGNEESSDVYKLARSAFANLQPSCSSESLMMSASAETLCQLDAEAFLLATVETTISAKKVRQSVLMVSSEKPLFLPLVVSDHLCTSEQGKWWSTAYKLFSNTSRENMTDMKRVLQHGLDVIRAIGNHGLSIDILCNLAKYFNNQVTETQLDSNDKLSIQRSIHYWKVAVGGLERLAGNLTLKYPKNRLFPSLVPEPSNDIVKELLDEGLMCLGNDAHMNGDYDVALKMFQQVQSAESAFDMAVVFKKLALKETSYAINNDGTRDSIIERRNALLIRARDCCYLTFDRIRGEKNHPLVNDLNAELKIIETVLQGGSEVSDDSSIGEADDFVDVPNINHSTPRSKSPKRKNPLTSPSPHRLELQIKSLAIGQEQLVKSIQEQNRALVEANRAMVEELKISKSIVVQLKDEMADLHKDLADLRIARDSTAPGPGVSADDFVDEYIEDSYSGDGGLLYHHQQFSAAKHAPAGFPMNYGDSMFPRHPQEPSAPRLPASHPASSFFPQAVGYQSPMHRFPVSIGLPFPPPPALYNHAQYMSPGSFGGPYPGHLPEPPRNYSMNQSQNLPISTLDNVPSGVLTPMNTTPVPPEINSTKDLPTPASNTLTMMSTPKLPVSSSSAVHPFQIAMPASAITPTKSPFLNEADLDANSPVEAAPNNSGTSFSVLNSSSNVPKSPDFKPIIPLPDEVQVVTGEENEDVQFAGQAKLYRLDDNQWKERGVGIVKILLNQQTQRARLLMRRDQVHRICANHQLVAGMSLMVKEGSKQTFLWCAQDYADEELKIEKFCIKFGDASLAVDFKKSFDDCIRLYGKVAPSPKSAAKTVEKATVGFGDAFKPKPGSWNCDACCLQNAPDAVVCIACQTERKTGQSAPFESKPTASNEDSGLKGKTPPQPTGFNFGGFSFGSNSNSKNSFVFNSNDNKAGTDGKPNVTFGGFSFSKTPQINTPKDEAKKESQKTKEITDESSAKTASPFAGFSFQSSTPVAPQTKSPISDVKSPNQSGQKEFEPNVSFEPVVPLPDLVEKKSGEEDEIKLFGERAKLFRYDPEARQWKEKGVGEIKIMKHKTLEKFRVVMRRDQVLKLCANHYIIQSMELLPMENSDKAWVWVAADFSEEQVKNEQLAVRFKTPDIALQFKEHFDKCLEALKLAKPTESSLIPAEPTPKTDVKGFGNLFKPQSGSWECTTCCVQNNADKTNCVACGTAKSGTAKSGTKPSFADSSFTLGQTGSIFGNTGSVKPAGSIAPPTSNATGFGELFKPKVGSWECATCCIRNEPTKVKCVACATAKPGTTAEELKKSDPQSQFSFGGSPKSIFGNTGPTPQGGFKFGTNNFTFKDSSGAFGDKQTSQPFTFGTNSNTGFTFATAKPTDVKPMVANVENGSLSKGSEHNLDASGNNSADYKFGSPERYKFNFGGVSPTRPTRTPKTSESQDEVEPSDADNLTFQPVCVMPPQIEVKTGEEDEQPLFCQRAKLFRMSDKEWKERGIGDVKLLRNKETGKIRLLMRRERILKLCCNHYLTPNMKFLEMDKRSYIWSATDFSEEKPVDEKFAIRFKDADVAQSFLAAVADAQGKLQAKTDCKPAVSPNNSSPQTFSFKINVNQQKDNGGAARSSPLTDDQKSVFGGTSLFGFNAKLSTPTNATTSGKFVFGRPQNSIFGNTMPSAESDPDIKVMYEKKASPENIKLARSLQLPDSFFLYMDKPKCSGCRGCEADGDNVNASPAAPVIKPAENSTPMENSSFFRNDNAMSFAALANQGSGFKTANENFTFAGAGAKLFDADKNATDDLDDADNKENNDDHNASTDGPHFEPVVPLPDKVEVKTGEEDEEVLFSQRAKLYRFDSGLQQWKERGVGNIKILRHLLRPNVFRILQRREQVHKLSCNHYITQGMSFKPLATSNTSWCWSAVDYADDRPVPENFAVKFKNADIANDFKNIAEKCLSDLDNVDDDNGAAIMFSKNATLGVKNATGDFQVVGSGKLVMFYNDEANGGRIQMYNKHDDRLVCDHMVSMRLNLTDASHSIAHWSALDSSDLDSPSFKDFQAEFHNAEDLAEFKNAFAKAKEYAEKSMIESEDQFYNADDSDEDFENVDDDSGDEDESNIMFMKRVTLVIQDCESNTQTSNVGELVIFYDDNVFGARIKVSRDDDKSLICDHMVAVQTTLRIDGAKATWTAIDTSDPNNAARKTFCATFSSSLAAQEFEEAFAECKELAIQSEIVENEAPN